VVQPDRGIEEQQGWMGAIDDSRNLRHSADAQDLSVAHLRKMA